MDKYTVHYRLLLVAQHQSNGFFSHTYIFKMCLNRNHRDHHIHNKWSLIYDLYHHKFSNKRTFPNKCTPLFFLPLFMPFFTFLPITQPDFHSVKSLWKLILPPTTRNHLLKACFSTLCFITEFTVPPAVARICHLETQIILEKSKVIFALWHCPQNFLWYKFALCSYFKVN